MEGLTIAYICISIALVILAGIMSGRQLPRPFCHPLKGTELRSADLNGLHLELINLVP